LVWLTGNRREGDREVAVLSRWPIRKKLVFGISLLLITVVILSFSGFLGVYAYRGLAKSISLRATELPLASELAQHVSALRVTLSHAERNMTRPTPLLSTAADNLDDEDPVLRLLQLEFDGHLSAVRSTFEQYRRQLTNNRASGHYRYIGDHDHEQRTVNAFEESLARISRLDQENWLLLEGLGLKQLRDELNELSRLSNELPSYLHRRMHNFADEVRGQYRVWIALTWTTSGLSTFLLILSTRLFYAWVFRPLGILIHGSRCVAAGEFGHRIHLHTQDEMAELARAMNSMTQRFQEIRDDLDRQVKQRTKEVVRSEQLASVGFLAAGVAHEINNPLASIALCAESMEERVHDIIQQDDQQPDGKHSDEIAVLRTYLRMIQDEAFRCKEITERLLDFSRMGDVEKQPTDLRELVRGVIEMVGHLGKYKQKQVVLRDSEPVVAPVNAQELKQVVLNLITNGLDSLDPGGQVAVSLCAHGQHAELVVEDNGCGMTDEVQEHLFEPFFTRRRDGQGTGLGMSITYRIIADHGGHIAVHSDGPGRGARFTITLPLGQDAKRKETHHPAA
jgi:signal transduction histidine kinase